MKDLKVLHIINNLSSGGAENALINYLNHDNNNTNYLFRLSAVEKNSIQLNTEKITDLNNYKKKDLFSLLKLLKHAMNIKPDIVHAHLFPSFYYAALISFFINAKFITTEHSLNNNRRKRYMRGIEKVIYSRFSLIISVSLEVKKNLDDWVLVGSNKKHVVQPNGIDLNYIRGALKHDLRLELAFHESDVIIVSSSRLTKEKNLMVAIKAFKYLPKQFKLILIGEGPEENLLKDAVVNLNLENQVILLGYRSDVINLVKSADIFLLPSINEGFGISVLEAIAAHRRIVLSNIPTFVSIYSTISPTYFNVHSSIDLAEKLIASMGSEVNNSIYDNFILDYNMETTVNKLNTIYQNLF